MIQKTLPYSILSGCPRGETQVEIVAFCFLFFAWPDSFQYLQVLYFSLISVPGIARCFGSDANAKAIENVYFGRVKAGVKQINETLAHGGDPKDIEVNT